MISFVGLIAVMFLLVLVMGGGIALLLLLCSRGGRRFLAICGAATVAALVVLVLLPFFAYVIVGSRQAAGPARIQQDDFAEQVRRGWIEVDRHHSRGHEGGVTLDLRLRSDAVQDALISAETIAAAIQEVLDSIETDVNGGRDLAEVPLANLMRLEVPLGEGKSVTLAELMQIGWRDTDGEAPTDDAIRLRFEGNVSPETAEAIRHAARLVEESLSSEKNPLLALVEIQSDEKGGGFTVHIPAPDVRRVAAEMSLPGDLDSAKEHAVPSAESSESPLAAAPVAVEVSFHDAKPTSSEPDASTAHHESAHGPEGASAQVAADATSAEVGTPQPSESTEEASGSRPDWVGKVQDRLPNGVYRMTASAGPYSTQEECFDQQSILARQLAEKYKLRLLGRDGARVALPSYWIESTLVQDQWIEPVESEALGVTMYNIHVLVEFDDAARRALERMWHDIRLQQRLTYTGALSALVLTLLGTTFGYLRLDTATRGFYSGRLKVAAVAVVAAATAAALGAMGLI